MDDLARWQGCGWVSFGPDRVDAIEQRDMDELRFVRDVVRSGLTDAQVCQLFTELPRPMNFDCYAVAYSFALGWVMVRPQPDNEEIVNEHVDEWLRGLADAEDAQRLTDLRDQINSLLSPLVGPKGQGSQ